MSSFRRRWPTLLKYALVGVAASVCFSGSAAAQDAKDQQIEALTRRLEKLEQQNQKLMQLVDSIHQKQLVVPSGMSMPSTSSQPEDVKKVVEKILKDKEDTKKAEDEKKKKEAAEKGYEVGSDNKLSAKFDLAKGLRFESENKDFQLHLGAQLQFDTVFWQQPQYMKGPAPGGNLGIGNPGSTGVGNLDDGMFMRRVRTRFDGTLYETYEFNAELALEPVNQVQFIEMWYGVKELPFLGTVRVGQHKVPMGLESYSSDKVLPMMERSSQFDAFWQEFMPGVYVTNTGLDQHMTWHFMFSKVETFQPNDGASFGDGEFAYTGRVTFLPWYENEGRCLLHLGASAQWRDSNIGRLSGLPGTSTTGTGFVDTSKIVRFRDRPELRDSVGSFLGTTSRFVDTGNIVADGVATTSLEMLMYAGPLWFQSEASLASVPDASYPATPAGTKRGTVNYWGAYFMAGYFLTGEHRGYDRRFGKFTGVVPNENFFAIRDEEGRFNYGLGAWEVIYRYSFLDLNDQGINGGMLGEHTFGVNWHMTPTMKMQVNYLITDRNVPLPAQSGVVSGLGVRFHYDF